MTAEVGRRAFLAGAGGAALVLAVPLDAAAAAGPGAAQGFAPNAFLRVEADGSVEVTVPKTEIGQGVRTSLAMLVAEELAVAFEVVRVRTAEADPRYGSQFTAGSTSIRTMFEPMRRAGATGRALLVRAAARRWGVPDAECRAGGGIVAHPDRGALPYAALLAEAAALDPATVPVALLPPERWRVIGRSRRRVDNADVVTGRARYGLDTARPGGLVAVLARPPRLGATAASVDASAARAVPGVVAVEELPSGVAVLAGDTAAALRGRDALVVEWVGGDPGASSARWLDELATAVPAAPDGPAGTRFSASFRMPILAHACMEPINATAHVADDGTVRVWVGTQNPEGVRRQAAQLAGVDVAKVTVEIPLAGGGFGRRGDLDATEEAVRLSALARRPVKVMWTRQDDMRCGTMRPASAHTLHAVLDERGTPIWRHHSLATWPLTVAPFFGPELIRHSADRFRYAVPGEVDVRVLPAPLPTGFWRSVYAGQLVVAEELFLTAIGARGGADQVALRRGLLTGQDRLRACLDAAASAFGWGRPLPAGHGAGVACLDDYGSAAAVIAEVAPGPRAVRVVAAVDLGVVVNPSGAQAQVQGAVADAVSTAFGAQITVRDGAVVQSSFRDYPWLRIDEAPRVDVVLVPSTAAPGGAGELAYPPAAAALAGAVHAATGVLPAGLPVVGPIG